MKITSQQTLDETVALDDFAALVKKLHKEQWTVESLFDVSERDQAIASKIRIIAKRTVTTEQL